MSATLNLNDNTHLHLLLLHILNVHLPTYCAAVEAGRPNWASMNLGIKVATPDSSRPEMVHRLKGIIIICCLSSVIFISNNIVSNNCICYAVIKNKS